MTLFNCFTFSGTQERKRTRAQPPDGWIGESRSVKKRQVATRLQHLLGLSGKEDQVDNGGTVESDDSPSPGPPQALPALLLSAPVIDNRSRTLDRRPSRGDSKPLERPPLLSPKSKRKNSLIQKKETESDSLDTNNNNEEKKEDWKETMKRMREQIKQVQELPTVEVPKSLKKNITSASSPDLSLYSSGTKTSRMEASWEIRARYRNMRNEELYKSQLVKKSGYSWREKVPEIQNPKLKFSESRSNIVTDMAFIGATYVQVGRHSL